MPKKRVYPGNKAQRKKLATEAFKARFIAKNGIDAWQEYNRSSDRKSHRKLRDAMHDAYGGKCQCCGETEREFLTLEHLNRDGAAHRKRLGGSNSNCHVVWRDLRDRGWPKDAYALYCFNCNHASWKLGTCPHQTKKNLENIK